MPKYVMLGVLPLAASSEMEIAALVINPFLTATETVCHAGNTQGCSRMGKERGGNLLSSVACSKMLTTIFPLDYI